MKIFRLDEKFLAAFRVKKKKNSLVVELRRATISSSLWLANGTRQVVDRRSEREQKWGKSGEWREREGERKKKRENRKEKERKNKEVCTFLPDMYFRALNDSEALASVHIALNYVRIHSDTFVCVRLLSESRHVRAQSNSFVSIRIPN